MKTLHKYLVNKKLTSQDNIDIFDGKEFSDIKSNQWVMFSHNGAPHFIVHITNVFDDNYNMFRFFFDYEICFDINPENTNRWVIKTCGRNGVSKSGYTCDNKFTKNHLSLIQNVQQLELVDKENDTYGTVIADAIENKDGTFTINKF